MTDKKELYAEMKVKVDAINAAITEAEAFATQHELSFSLDLGWRSMSFETTQNCVPDCEEAPGWFSSSDYC